MIDTRGVLYWVKTEPCWMLMQHSLSLYKHNNEMSLSATIYISGCLKWWCLWIWTALLYIPFICCCLIWRRCQTLLAIMKMTLIIFIDLCADTNIWIDWFKHLQSLFVVLSLLLTLLSANPVQWTLYFVIKTRRQEGSLSIKHPSNNSSIKNMKSKRGRRGGLNSGWVSAHL